MADTKHPAPGWYDDPEMANTRRYWDGGQWTSHRYEKNIDPGPDDPARSVVIAGILFAIFLPIVGFCIGLTQLNKRGHDGLGIVVLSVVFFGVYAGIFAAL